jgi:hypothetical protein
MVSACVGRCGGRADGAVALLQLHLAEKVIDQ